MCVYTYIYIYVCMHILLVSFLSSYAKVVRGANQRGIYQMWQHHMLEIHVSN